MSADKEPRCFRCGQAAGGPPRFRFLPNGAPCPICRDRLLESLPAALPGAEGAAEPCEQAPTPARAVEGGEEGS
ncbi:MAG: hypothetical protein CMJ84_07630 [Planctomycetes bacterium]|jgi:hypothetical protein|nr:hypothetical protein [Planctomycetota bacterium]MDP6409353.1 hypothetical protein [Planctomycetota bacterium]